MLKYAESIDGYTKMTSVSLSLIEYDQISLAIKKLTILLLFVDGIGPGLDEHSWLISDGPIPHLGIETKGTIGVLTATLYAH